MMHALQLPAHAHALKRALLAIGILIVCAMFIFEAALLTRHAATTWRAHHDPDVLVTTTTGP